MERREWKLEPLPIHGWRIVDSDGTVIVGDVYEFETGVQIVNDHNQHTALVEQRDLLVAALQEMTDKFYPHTCKFHGPQICDKCEALRKASRALATTVEQGHEELAGDGSEG